MMKKFSIALLIFVALQTVGAQSPLDVKTITLDNGFTVWFNEDRTQASVFGAVVVKAGAKDSPGTGIAHYFEHIMFKGTDNIGTIDFEAEKVYLDSIAHEYSRLAQTTDDAQRRQIQQEINRLSIAAAQYAIPNEFNNLIEKMGGSNLNAGTGFDQTLYYNVFIPQYIHQWLGLNSERLLNPVFRLFQSELETVYEEKNMYADMSVQVGMEKLLERFFAPHPYMYPIIGETEHLKNPDLVAMEQFFRDYYVAGNMGLILSGDFNAEEIMPTIAETFGRLPAGNAPEIIMPEIQPFNGRETTRILMPIPFMKMGVSMWRSVPNGAADEVTLNAAVNLLSNSNQTGYLDLLGTDGKVLMAQAGHVQLNDAGVLMAITVPKLLFQSYRRAENLVMSEINRVKNGDFTDEELQNVKLQMRRDFQLQLENFERKGNIMAMLFTEGRTWDDYLCAMNSINDLTREDIIAVANRYFTENFLAATKKTGRHKIERIEKPNFAPIVPPNRNETSAYVQNLIAEAAAMPIIRPRTIDFEHDAQMIELSPLVTLYTKENPVNDIFQWRLNYRKGNLADNRVQYMATYLNDLPTDSLTYLEFQNGLRQLGATVNFTSNNDAFVIDIMGFDEHIEPTLQLISHFMHHAAPNKKALKRIVSAQRLEKMFIKREPQTVADALFQFVAHGNHSMYLTDLSAREIRRMGNSGMLDVFRETIQTEKDIHYTGRRSADEIKSLALRYFNPENSTQAAKNPIDLPLQRYDRPIVFVVDLPKAKQSIIYGYTFSPAAVDDDFRNASRLFNEYFGGGMSSLMFQEIREFRSFAYMAASRYRRPNNFHNENGSYLQTILSTQSDKTIEALTILDSLLNDMPIFPEKIADAKQSLRNDISNSFPTFRNVSQFIAELKRLGFERDANENVLDGLDEMDIDTIIEFYTQHIKDNITCYVIVGNMKQVDMRELAKFGEVRKLGVRDIVR